MSWYFLDGQPELPLKSSCEKERPTIPSSAPKGILRIEKKEVIMAKLTDEAKKAIAEIRPSLVATASGTGKPNVSAKGSVIHKLHLSDL